MSNRIFKSHGYLRYAITKWWLVVDCNDELGDYYRSLIQKHLGGARKVNRPKWKYHISVVRNECPPLWNQHLWKQYDGLEIEYQYSNNIQSNGIYFWLPVESLRLLKIRQELGLSKWPFRPLHLTIGNLKCA